MCDRKMTKYLRVLAIFVVLTCMVHGAPQYERQYGSGSDRSQISRPSTPIAGAKNPAGSQKEGTLKQSSYPRCGVINDVAKRFKLSPDNSKWRKKQLTYKISKYYSRGTMTEKEVDQTIQRALKMWSDVTDLTFRVVDPKRDDRPDIDIRFESFNHGSRDGDVPFDGAGGVLAHAFYPTDGRVHFDDSETWTLNEGIQLLQVAAHEFGHTLGLDHSEKSEAVMTPIFRNRPDFRLHEDDIRGVQTLYGANRGSRGSGGYGVYRGPYSPYRDWVYGVTDRPARRYRAAEG